MLTVLTTASCCYDTNMREINISYRCSKSVTMGPERSHTDVVCVRVDTY